MHDIDRTQMEWAPEMESFEFSGGAEVFGEQETMELAAELLEVTNEAEMDHFLGDLISKASKAVGSFMNSSTGQALGGLLKGVAKKALPAAGQAIGSYFGGSTGANIGGKIGSAASNILGLETEAEDREMEAASTFVKLAADAVKNAATSPQGANPRAIATAAITEAAKVHAPGLLAPPSGPPGPGGPANAAGASGTVGRARTGRWLRRGSKIVLYGV